MALSPDHVLAMALDPCLLFEARGFTPDPWQSQVLRSPARKILLNCCRQGGKSTTVAALALHTALFKPNALVLLLARAQRQASEIFRKVLEFYNALGRPVKPIAESVLRLELPNNSRVISLPGNEANLRSYSAVDLLVIDEAARVPDDLYRSVRPMLIVSHGRIMILSTPWGKRGFFSDIWADKADEWHKVEIKADLCPRISKEDLEKERRDLGESWYRQEYECNFDALEGLVYPDFSRCVVDIVPPLHGKAVGGIDFGLRNPFAAVWGILDNNDILWLTDEVYQRNATLSQNAKRIPKTVRWWADPAGANEIGELKIAGYVVSRGDNAIRAGIAAVTSRIQSGRLKILSYGCPNLIEEAGLYRYPNPQERRIMGENPVDESNHALAAVRYLISKLDKKFMVKWRRIEGSGARGQGPETGSEANEPDTMSMPEPVSKRINWLDPRNPELWTPLT